MSLRVFCMEKQVTLLKYLQKRYYGYENIDSDYFAEELGCGQCNDDVGLAKMFVAEKMGRRFCPYQVPKDIFIAAVVFVLE